MLISRLTMHEAPLTQSQKIMQNLYAVCVKLGGHDWEPYRHTLNNWLVKATPEQVDGFKAVFDQLIWQLDLYADLIATLGENSSGLVQHLRVWRLKFRMALQKHKNAQGTGWDKIYVAVKQISAAPSPEQIAGLTDQIRNHAKDLLQRFIDELPAQP